MSRSTTPPTGTTRAIAVAAILFGLLSLYKSGAVLMDLGAAREAAGAYVPFVVQFNFGAAFVYVFAGAAIWSGRIGQAYALAVLLAAATLLVAAAFAVHVALGGAFEMRTVPALGVRAAFWAMVALLIVLGRVR